jgi:succinate dehydrogenase / fumarate reductase cytochrome b subunit
MTTERPVFLDLRRIKLPISAVVSILHRVSGVLMVLSTPLLTALFAQALSSPGGFTATARLLGHPAVGPVLLVLLWALLHHLLAGLRYLLIDLGLGVDLPVARASAWTAVSAALVVAILAGVLL